MTLTYVDVAPDPSGMVATMAYVGCVPTAPPAEPLPPSSLEEHAASAATVVENNARAIVDLNVKIIYNSASITLGRRCQAWLRQPQCKRPQAIPSNDFTSSFHPRRGGGLPLAPRSYPSRMGTRHHRAAAAPRAG